MTSFFPYIKSNDDFCALFFAADKQVGVENNYDNDNIPSLIPQSEKRQPGALSSLYVRVGGRAGPQG